MQNTVGKMNQKSYTLTVWSKLVEWFANIFINVIQGNPSFIQDANANKKITERGKQRTMKISYSKKHLLT